ncbi:hypothetical protein VR010_01430 [Actinomycetaceae bacterium L2_0104]
MRLIQALGGAVCGLLIGALACVVYPGPVDVPWVGLILATALVAAGAWFLLEWEKPPLWLGYVVGVVAATFWLMMSPLDNDTVMSVHRWASEAWLIMAPLSAMVPALFVLRRRK